MVFTVQFQYFVYNFAGGSPESNQYFFNMPKLLQINASTNDDPQEDPCEEAEDLPDQKEEEEGT